VRLTARPKQAPGQITPVRVPARSSALFSPPCQARAARPCLRVGDLRAFRNPQKSIANIETAVADCDECRRGQCSGGVVAALLPGRTGCSALHPTSPLLVIAVSAPLRPGLSSGASAGAVAGCTFTGRYFVHIQG
jgi:hypothetical protein